MTQPVICFLSGDLMFASRVRGACEHAGAKFYFGSNLPKEGDSDTRLVILDLATRSGITGSLVADAKSRFPNAQVIAYGPHVHKARLDAAMEAGFDAVMTRGQFDSWITKLPDFLDSTAND